MMLVSPVRAPRVITQNGSIEASETIVAAGDNRRPPRRPSPFVRFLYSPLTASAEFTQSRTPVDKVDVPAVNCEGVESKVKRFSSCQQLIVEKHAS